MVGGGDLVSRLLQWGHGHQCCCLPVPCLDALGWWVLDKEVTMSPLEIAKTFGREVGLGLVQQEQQESIEAERGVEAESGGIFDEPT